MLQSMTGFGKANASYNNKNISVEIRSLNSKFLDLNVRIPQLYRDKEVLIRKWSGEHIMRGKAEVAISIDNHTATGRYLINEDLVSSYVQQLKGMATDLGQRDDDLLSSVLRMPEVIAPEAEQVDEAEWLAVEQLFHQAVADFKAFRANEGQALLNDIIGRVDTIKRLSIEVQALYPTKVASVRERLTKQLETFVEQKKIDATRLEHEMVFYLEKLDINEEVVRLASHCDYLKQTIASDDATKGKKLGFINQEIGREINTIGSKINDANIQKLVVQMKDELEKMKEQAMNVL